MNRAVDLKSFKTKAGRNKKLYEKFLRGLYYRKERKQIDNMAPKLNTEAFENIDCLSCGNCCKTMTPTYTKSDLKRIAAHVGMTTKEYYDKYCEKDSSGDTVHKKTPCHFLQKDNKCSIYAIRPLDCSGFPHMHKRNPGFVGSYTANKEFFHRCPISYYVVDAIYQKVMANNK